LKGRRLELAAKAAGFFDVFFSFLAAPTHATLFQPPFTPLFPPPHICTTKKLANKQNEPKQRNANKPPQSNTAKQKQAKTEKKTR
jgi:hypothetical protein